MKLNNIYSLFVLGAALLWGSAAHAQMMSVPYSMDWEVAEQAEISNWVLNPGANAASCPDQWVVGTATHSAGRRSLYISCNGAENKYTVARNVQYVYRDVMLPAGKYVFSFDWKTKGSTKSTLSAGYALASQVSTAMAASSTTGTVPTAILNKCNSAMKQKHSQEDWTNTSFQIQSNGTDATRVFFVWSNTETDTTACDMGACIDNIQITSTACPRPDNLSAVTNSCDEVLFKWKGASADYQVQYRQVGTDTWNTCYDVMAQGNNGTATCTGMNEGSYDFRVRGICTPDTSAWTYLTSVVIYCAELHCINFTDLYADNVVCTSGTTSSSGYAATKQNAYSKRGVIDYGPDDKRSRHTINSDPTATDPRTGGNLPLIPQGSKFSVRLGNWEVDYGAEAISYTYTVDSTMAIVLLQYAVVLEDPDGHGDDALPRFLLEVLDENGTLLDPTCGLRNFTPQQDWEEYTDASTGYYGETVRYKPWTTVGLNLNELGVHDGDQITVRLTTYDCFWSAHYGYAYFTLDCAAPTIETHTCAKGAQASSMELTAPAGFTYQWLDKDHNILPGQTDKTFYPTDTTTYYCRLTSTENASCTFELESYCVPRLPIPEFTLNYEPKDCKNIVRIGNTSHPRIVLKDKVINEYNQKCDSYHWRYWGDQLNEQTSSRDSFKVTLPQEGGTYYFELTVELQGGCDSTMTRKIVVPKIGDSRIEETAALCEHSGVWFFDNYITYESIMGQDTTIELGGKTAAGCDSIVNMYVYKAPSYNITLDTIQVYEGGTYSLAGQDYTVKSSRMYSTLLQTTLGCDSMVMQYVEMVPCLNLIDQRWGDVLFVLNEDGQRARSKSYTETFGYQWLKDGQPIPGATGTYLYVPEGLDTESEYSVIVKVASGEELETCTIVPKAYTSSAPKKVLRNGRIIIIRDGETYDLFGNKL